MEPGKTKLRAIADKVVSLATEGDIRAIREVADRLDGKTRQQIEMAQAETGSFDRFTDQELHEIIEGTYGKPVRDSDTDSVH